MMTFAGLVGAALLVTVIYFVLLLGGEIAAWVLSRLINRS
jgi:hypothetical protein